MKMLNDRYGNRVSTSSTAALAHYDEALLLNRLYRGDPIAALDAALAEDPGFTMAWAARAQILVQQGDRAYLAETERSLDAGVASGGTDDERAHLAAAADWACGRVERSVSGFMAIARDNPRDMMALQTAHLGHFFLGRASDLRDGPVQALRAFCRDDDGYHAVLGMAAFGLEECGDYGRAEALGSEAVAIDPRDAWALHAVAHVHEMRGDTESGMAWLNGNDEAMAAECGFSYHNWWHLALLHLDRNEHDAALALYDSHIRPDPDGDALLQWIDASALLWRLHLDDVDTGNRFGRLADRWQRASDDRWYAFNDCHAIMAFIGAGRLDDARICFASLTRAADQDDDNARVARSVGLPVAAALLAFAEGRYGEAAEALIAIRGSAARFGGSHAQRDILSLTALHAAKRGNMTSAAEALVAERRFHKPTSPWVARLANHQMEGRVLAMS
ncbi:tetratricopeptide repeat protein [Sphingopyxis sp.]|uniref:tetratricopeptide repeat protein n=1 Tax=Sphingopyxis sp. TaxID=1908224 RepID=UPI001E01D134|nr:tetratricopeptide repeat protein [Sphingopyxis sp.]MBW8297351.1 tetratricopeptide repeat protein [Sphingopyxis sp.]